MIEINRIVEKPGVDGKQYWCFELKSPVHGRWITVSEHRTHDEAKQARRDCEEAVRRDSMAKT